MITKFTKLFLINFLIFISLLIIINLVVITIYQGYQLYKDYARLSDNAINSMASLPNYVSVEWASKHFKEFRELPSEYQSYVGWRRQQYFGTTINIDNKGIRNTPQNSKVSPNSSLVVFMGGSTMWGTGANDQNTIPAIFSNIGDGKYKTLNFGESGYRSFQSYIFLRMMMNEGLKPDIIISYDGVNEIAGFLSEHNSTSHSREFQIRNVLKSLDSDKRDELSFQKFLLDPITSFIKSIKRKTQPAPSPNYDLSYDRVHQVAKSLLNSWLNTKKIAEDNGAKFYAVLQPNVAIGSPNISHLNIDSFQIEPYKHLYPMILMLLKTTEYYELNKNFIDLTESLDGDEFYYIDFCHLSPNGNEIVAKELISEIEKKD